MSEAQQSPDVPLARALFGTLIRPRSTFASMAACTSSRSGGAAVAVLGMLWGLLCLLLWSSHRAPHAVLLPIAPENYYLLQGLFMLPILTGLWWVFSEITHRLAGGGLESPVRTALGFAYAAPMSLHVSAELLAHLLLPDRLALVAAITLPLASLAVWALSALAVHTLLGTRWPRAIASAGAGLFVQALAGGLVLR